MTILEESYMRTTPAALREIGAALEAAKPRVVRIQKNGENEIWVNPASVTVVNATDGVVHIGLTLGFSMPTDFKTAEEAVKALGLG